MEESKEVRKNPCASCPYRRDVPSGIWAQEEYDILRAYDGEIVDQLLAGAERLFGCHQADGRLCAGWVGHREHPVDLVAIRIAISDGRLDESVLDYSTSVPLFESGAEAAEHGCRDINAPSDKAMNAVHKILSVRDDIETS